MLANILSFKEIILNSFVGSLKGFSDIMSSLKETPNTYDYMMLSMISSYWATFEG